MDPDQFLEHLSEQNSAPRLHRESGVFTSTNEQHMLLIELHPLRVACLRCVAVIDRKDFLGHRDFEKAAKEFTDKHGYLDKKIAIDLDGIIQHYVATKQQAFVYVPEIFDVGPKLVKDSLGIDLKK